MKNKLGLCVGALALMTTSSAFSAEKIHMINCGDDTGKGIPLQNALIKQWEAENEGYTVEVEFVPWGQCQEKSTTLASAGNPPAVAYMGSRTLKQLAKNDLIISVDMTDEEKASYAAPILATITSEGKQWGLPRAFSTKALYYNKDLFKAAGLDAEKPPTTWDEMYQAAKGNQRQDRCRWFWFGSCLF